MMGKTLPEIQRGIPDCSLDVLRSIVRRNPALRALGTLYGPTRVYGDVEVAQIRAAYDGRRIGKRKAAV